MMGISIGIMKLVVARVRRHAACVLNRESHKLAKDVGSDLRKSWSSWQSIIDEATNDIPEHRP